MRLFFALTLPARIRAVLNDWQQLWSTSMDKTNVKWVREENLHLTLKFLGQVAPDQLSHIVPAVRLAMAEQLPLTLTLGGIGAFPNPRRARVLWVGLQKGATELNELHQRLDSELANLGFPPEKRTFIPHLTLGRLRQPARLGTPPSLTDGLTFQGDRIVLYESILKPRGPLYKPLATFYFKH